MSSRGNPYPHRYKFGVPKKPIDLDVFLKFVDRLKVVYRRGYSVEFLEALHAMFFWTGLRKSEVLGRGQIKYKVMHKECHGKGCERCSGGKVFKTGKAHPGLLKEDLALRTADEGNYLLVYCVGDQVLKHGTREEPIWLHEGLPLVDRIIDRWKATEVKAKVFPCNYLAFWRICKDMDPKFTMHFYRHNRVTDWSSDETMSLADICAVSGLTPSTVSVYMMRAGRFSKKVGVRMKERFATD